MTPKGWQTVCFHLCDVLQQIKLWGQRTDLGCWALGAKGRYDCRGHKGFCWSILTVMLVRKRTCVEMYRIACRKKHLSYFNRWSFRRGHWAAEDMIVPVAVDSWQAKWGRGCYGNLGLSEEWQLDAPFPHTCGHWYVSVQRRHRADDLANSINNGRYIIFSMEGFFPEEKNYIHAYVYEYVRFWG